LIIAKNHNHDYFGQYNVNDYSTKLINGFQNYMNLLAFKIEIYLFNISFCPTLNGIKTEL